MTRWTGIATVAENNQVDVQPIYCKGRFRQCCEKLGLVSGFAFDLTEGYDMSKKRDKDHAWKAFEEGEPKLLVVKMTMVTARIVFVVPHAPHIGKPKEEVATYWNNWSQWC